MRRRRPPIPTYFVRGTDGKFYGPADLPTLSQWATEGRILADTVLVDQATNQQVTARNVPGLTHHFQLAPTTVQAPFQQQQQNWQNPPAPYSQAPQPLAARPGPYGYYARKSKLAAALLAFFLGGLGIHRFYLGYTTIGIVMLSVCLVGSFVCCGLGAMITGVWAIVDFVLILINQLPDANGQSLD